MAEKRSIEGWHASPPFQHHLGIETVEAAGGRTLLTFTHRPELGNRKGDVHGGILATLVDIAMSQAIRSVSADMAGTATISMNINYLEPASGTITTRGLVIKRGRSVSVAEATCEDASGRAVAHATGTFRMIGLKK